MDVLDNIKEAIRLLEENDNKAEELNLAYSQADRKIDFWLHRIELERIPVTQAYKIIKEIKKQRQIRRKCKNELELLRVFKDNENKLCNSGNRKILLAQVCKTANKQQNAKYSYDAYSEEEIKDILDIWLIEGKDNYEKERDGKNSENRTVAEKITTC